MKVRKLVLNPDKFFWLVQFDALLSRVAGSENPLISPEIVVELLASDAPAFDPGELGVAVAPPAIANALYSATGVRFRRLPLLSEGL